MTHTALETHDAKPGFATIKLRLREEFDALKSRSSAVLSSPYVLGGAALGIAAAGYALVRRKKAAPPDIAPGHDIAPARRFAPARDMAPARDTAPARGRDRGDVLKVVGALVSLAASFAATREHARVDEDAVKRDVDLVPARAEAPPSDVKDTPPAKTTSKNPTFEQTSSSWIGRQWQICVAAANAWNDDYAPSMGAALSYYMLFSLAPLLVIVIAIAGLVFGHDAAQGAIIAQLGGIMGKEGATAVQNLLNAAHEPSTGIVASIIGGLVLLVGATAMFAELQSDLDRIWQVPAKDKPSGIWGWLRSRVLSFGLVLGVAFMLMISLVVSAALAASGEWLSGGSEAGGVIANVLNFVASLAIFTLLFAMIYKIMPSAKISWHDVWMGSAVTALLFNVGKSLISLYLAKSSVTSGFGAAGSIVFLVAWFYYSAQIFLFGAEYTWVYANSKPRVE